MRVLWISSDRNLLLPQSGIVSIIAERRSARWAWNLPLRLFLTDLATLFLSTSIFIRSLFSLNKKSHSMKFTKTLLAALFCLGCSLPYAVGETTRPNAFIIQSAQAGSTTEIDDLKITDLDTANVVYENKFDSSSDAIRGLNSFYWPQGGKDTESYELNGPKTRVENGKLILETTGFNQNGNGGYESHSETEPTQKLPANFRVEFTAKRLQWAGHFRFYLFRRVESDVSGAYRLGGSLSGNRSSSLPVDIIHVAASGNWFG